MRFLHGEADFSSGYLWGWIVHMSRGKLIIWVEEHSFRQQHLVSLICSSSWPKTSKSGFCFLSQPFPASVFPCQPTAHRHQLGDNPLPHPLFPSTPTVQYLSTNPRSLSFNIPLGTKIGPIFEGRGSYCSLQCILPRLRRVLELYQAQLIREFYIDRELSRPQRAVGT